MTSRRTVGGEIIINVCKSRYLRTRIRFDLDVHSGMTAIVGLDALQPYACGRRSRSQSVAAHDLHHLRAIRRTNGRRRSNIHPRPSFHRSPELPRGHKESLDRSSSSFLHAFVDSSFRVRAFSRRETAGITRLPSTHPSRAGSLSP